MVDYSPQVVNEYDVRNFVSPPLDYDDVSKAEILLKIESVESYVKYRYFNGGSLPSKARIPVLLLVISNLISTPALAKKYYTLSSETLGDYCLPDTTETLTKEGWKNPYELKLDDEILGYDEKSDRVKWTKVEDIHITPYIGKMLHLKSKRNSFDTLATPNHRWYVKPIHSSAKWSQRIKTSKDLNTWDTIPRAARSININNTEYSDEFVECVGWFVTEGNWQKSSRTGKIYSAFINQNKIVNRNNCNSIRKCLNKLLDDEISEHKHGNGNIGFYIPANTKLFNDLKKVCPNKQLTMNFITSINTKQLNLLWKVMKLGDGDKKRDRFYQKLNETMNSFQALSVLCGYGTTLRKKDDNGVYSLSCQTKRNVGVKNLHNGFKDYKGIVWCPKTSLGTWLVRDKGVTFLTGNSYTLAEPISRGMDIQSSPFIITKTWHGMAIEMLEKMSSPSDYVVRKAND